MRPLRAAVKPGAGGAGAPLSARAGRPGGRRRAARAPARRRCSRGGRASDRGRSSAPAPPAARVRRSPRAARRGRVRRAGTSTSKKRKVEPSGGGRPSRAAAARRRRGVLPARRARPLQARSGEGPRRGDLRGGRRRVEGVGGDLAQLDHQRTRADHVAAAVACHAEALREALGQEGALRGERQRRHRLARVDDLVVDLVGEDPEVASPRPPDQRLDPGARQHPPARVVGRGQVDGDGALRRALLERRDQPLRRVDLAGERRHRHGHAVEGAHDALDQRPVGGEDQHLVARLEQRPGHGAEAAGGAGGHQHVVALEREPGPLPLVLDHGVEQAAVAVDRGVAVHPRVLGDRQVLHPAPRGRLHPGVADVERVGLPAKALQSVGEPRVDRGEDRGEVAGGVRGARHGVGRGGVRTGRL